MKPAINDPTTLCWVCKRAANALLDDDVVCPWSSRLQPVEGWEATHMPSDSYIVMRCPLFAPEQLLCSRCTKGKGRDTDHPRPCGTSFAYAGASKMVGYCGKFTYYDKDTTKEIAKADRNDTTPRRVKQYTRDYKFLKVWPSLSAASRATGVQVSGIASVCQGRRRSAGTYIWEYERER